MGVRAPVSRGARTLTLITALTTLVAANLGATHGGDDRGFWSDLPTVHLDDAAPAAPSWLDALDVGAAVRASSADAELAAEVTLRFRLDAEHYLERVRAEGRDLAGLAAALARHQRHGAQVQWLAGRCQGAWRAWQVRSIDLGLERAGAPASLEHAAELDHLHALRALLQLDATQAAAATEVRACRLASVLEGIALAADHPLLVSAALERSIVTRTEAMFAAPAPASAWLHAEVRSGSFGPDGALRVGLDLPLRIAGAELEASLSADPTSAQARLSWHRYGAATDRHFALAAERSPADPEAAERALRDGLRRRVIEAELLRGMAERHWREVCGDGGAEAVVACLSAGPRSEVHLGALIVAIDAELAAVQASLAAIDASGHALATVIGLPP